MDNWGGVIVYRLPDDREPEAVGVVAVLGVNADEVLTRYGVDYGRGQNPTLRILPADSRR